jgi:hypothetical protein
MIREFYTRNANDPLYEKTKIESKDILETLLAKIRMILGTTPYEVLGSPNMGVDLESMVFKSKTSHINMEDIIMKQFDLYINGTGGYKVTPKVKFGHHRDGYDYATVEIFVDDMRIQGFVIE